MKALVALTLFAGVSTANAATQTLQSELPVVGDRTIVAYKITPTTISYGHVIFQGYKDRDTYTLVACVPTQEHAESFANNNGSIVLQPGSKILLKTAIGAQFGTGEVQPIKSKFIELSCELN